MGKRWNELRWRTGLGAGAQVLEQFGEGGFEGGGGFPVLEVGGETVVAEFVSETSELGIYSHWGIEHHPNG
jgi:hypothetical protein